MVGSELLERVVDLVLPGRVGEELAAARERQLRGLVSSWESEQPSWIRDLPAIIEKARATIEAGKCPEIVLQDDEYTGSDDGVCAGGDGLDLYEAGTPDGVYHLVICLETEGGAHDEKHPVLEIKIRPYEVWLEKMRGPSARKQPVAA